MATPIKILAGHIMDDFYQDYPSNEEFFSLSDFIFQTGSAYADILSKEFDVERLKMKQDGIDTYVSFSHDWLQTQVLQLQRKSEEGEYYQLLQKPMSFPYDKWDSGLQNVFPVGAKNNNELVRATIDTNWQNKFSPLTHTIYWTYLKDKIYPVTSLQSAPPSIRVVYIPEVSLDLEIPNSRNAMISVAVLTVMRKLSEGFLIDESNNQNKNKLPVTENDPNLIKR